MKIKEKVGPTLVYTVILLAGGIMLFLSSYFFGPIFLNLGTELIGAAVIFFILQNYVIGREQELKGKIAQLHQELVGGPPKQSKEKGVFSLLESMRQELAGRTIQWDNHYTRNKDIELGIFNMEEFLKPNFTLLLAGQNMSAMLGKLEAVIPPAINEGLIVKIITLSNERNNLAIQQIAEAQNKRAKPEGSIFEGTDETFYILQRISGEIKKLYPKYKGSLEHRTFKHYPPYSSILLGKETNGPSGKVKVVFYRPSEFRVLKNIKPRLRIIGDRNIHPELYANFEEQFFLMWDNLASDNLPGTSCMPG